MRKTLFALPVLALIAGSAVYAESWKDRRDAREIARLEKALAGKTPGKPQNCIELRDAQGPEAVGETTLLFRSGRNLVWRTETRGSCRDISRGNALVTQTFGSRLCRGDMARAVDLLSGFSGGHCSMGDFTPYRGS